MLESECIKFKIPIGKSKDITGQKFHMLTPVFRVTNHENGRSRWACRCDCGEFVMVTSHELTQGKKQNCGNHNYDDLAGKKFGEVIALRPIDSAKSRQKIWECLCSCGSHCNFRSDILKTGKHIQCKNHIVSTIVGETYGKLTVLKYLGKDRYRHMFLCSCSCGSVVSVSMGNLRSGHTVSCGCVKTSFGEDDIQRIFIENSIEYMKNKSFDGCRFPDTGYMGYFDFYLPKQNLLIEFDGKQHFEYSGVGWDVEDNYISTHNRDLFKNKWAWDNKIRLKRIPFTERTSLTLDLLLSDQYIISPKTHPQWYPKDNEEYPYFVKEVL